MFRTDISSLFQVADEDLSAKVYNPCNFLRPVLDKAHTVMQSQLKEFLRACLQEHLSKGKVVEAPTTDASKNRTKIFSFGVLEGEGEEGKKVDTADNKPEAKQEKKHDAKQEGEQEDKPEEEADKPKADATPRFKEMPASTFVSSVLFPMTDTTPQVQHALVFRRSMDQFTKLNQARFEELAEATGETSIPAANRRKSDRDELAIEFLDKAIEDTVLPSLQQQAVHGTIIASEMEDAFDPPTEANVYARADKIQPLDVAMVQAGEGMLAEIEPLYMAIHRLPPGGAMYDMLVEILGFLVSTFLSTAEQKVGEICDETTADEILEGFGDDKGKLMAALGKREAFKMLLKAYEFDLDLIDDADMGGTEVKGDDDESVSPEKASKPSGDEELLQKNKIKRFEAVMKQEIEQLSEYMDFLPFHQESLDYDLSTESELKRASCLAHRYVEVLTMQHLHIEKYIFLTPVFTQSQLTESRECFGKSIEIPI